MEHSLTKIQQTADAGALGTVKQMSWLFPGKSELLRHQENTPEAHGPSPVKFTEECIFQVQPTAVALLPKSTYIFTFELGVNTQQFGPQTCLLNTGAGLNLISKASQKRQIFTNIKKQKFSRLRTATKEPISLRGKILLFISMNELSVRVLFGIVENLAIEVLLRTSFIDRYIRGNFPSERKVVPWNYSPVPILSRNNSSAV